MKKNTLGIVLSVLGILTGFLALYLLAATYMPVVIGKTAQGRVDEAITVRIVYALLAWVGGAAGALWVPVTYGLLKEKTWAWGWGLVASTALILTGFFPMIPAASADLSTPTVVVFVLGFILWFGMFYIGGVQKRIVALAFVSGLAYVLTFIDGVGAISRYQTSDDPFAIGMYASAQMINWWGAIVWVAFIYALTKGKTWTFPLGLLAVALSMFGGYPVGITDVLQIGRFSMFLVAPVVSTGLLIYLLLPGTRKMLGEKETG